MLLIDADSPGVHIEPVRVMGGWRVNTCFFDDVTVPVTNRIGAEGEGAAIVGTAARHRAGDELRRAGEPAAAGAVPPPHVGTAPTS